MWLKGSLPVTQSPDSDRPRKNVAPRLSHPTRSRFKVAKNIASIFPATTADDRTYDGEADPFKSDERELSPKTQMLQPQP